MKKYDSTTKQMVEEKLPITDLEGMRAQMLEAMSGVSEDRTAASWMQGWDRTLHAEGGIWKVIAEKIGWPVETSKAGEVMQFTWLTWQQAENAYGATEGQGDQALHDFVQDMAWDIARRGADVIRINHGGVPFDVDLTPRTEEEPPWQPRK